MFDALPDDARSLLTLDNGAQVRLRAISPALIQGVTDAIRERWAQQGQILVDLPTYCRTAFECGTTFTLTAHVIETSEVDESERELALAALHKAEDIAARFEHDRRKALIKLCFDREAVEVVSGKSIEAWEKIRRRMGLRIPADEDDRKIAYVLEYIISTPRDVQSILLRVLELSGVVIREVSGQA